jgi:hypothetical protein
VHHQLQDIHAVFFYCALNLYDQAYP